MGYGLLDPIPHFATVSYAFCKPFPDELTSKIFEHILNRPLSGSLRMRRRNTQCVIHTTEA